MSLFDEPTVIYLNKLHILFSGTTSSNSGTSSRSSSGEHGGHSCTTDTNSSFNTGTSSSSGVVHSSTTGTNSSNTDTSSATVTIKSTCEIIATDGSISPVDCDLTFIGGYTDTNTSTGGGRENASEKTTNTIHRDTTVNVDAVNEKIVEEEKEEVMGEEEKEEKEEEVMWNVLKVHRY